MANGALILAIDQGTTSSRAIVFDEAGKPVATAQQEFRQIFPHDGWVEHDPEEIWSTTLAVSLEAKQAAEVGGGKVAAIGITNQRETTVVWDRATGTPIYNAIVWQDRRTSATCGNLRDQGVEEDVTARTGLLLDPYFSATKIAWILDHVDGARARAEAGELAFGTIDSFLLWRLTSGAVHATDASNAARTLLMNLETGDWDPELLGLFDVPVGLLPEIRDNAAEFGTTELLGDAISIGGMAGDQQAATIGQACFAPGMVKSTYGTGCFALMNTGAERVTSKNRLLSTVVYRLKGEITFALEGSIFVAGAAVQWLRDGLKLIDNAAETEALARSVEDTGGVYLVPAFVGLGAPWWDADARGAIYGLTRDTTDAHIVRAALEAVCFQTHDLVAAMSADSGTAIGTLRVDGGMVANDWLVQCLADITGLPVERPVQSESTALGAAMLAGMQAGIWPDLDAIGGMWARDARFEPKIHDDQRDTLIGGWRGAIERTLTR